MQGKDKVTITHAPQIARPQTTTDAYEHAGWKFVYKKSGILPSKELDQLADDLNLQGIPDIVYGESCVQIINEAKNFIFEASPRDALSYVNIAHQKSKFKETFDKTSDTETITALTAEHKIKQAEHWKNKKVAEGTEIKTLEKKSDWTYSTPYKGSAKELNPTQKQEEHKPEEKKPEEEVTQAMEKLAIAEHRVHLQRTEEDIPLHNLTASNPIKWYCELHLFEDELGDCGLSQSTFRFRVMGDCFFGLLRHYLRIDDVVIRIYDTRIYHTFGTDYILREFTVRENTFDELKIKGFKFGADFITNHRQSDVVYPSLELKSTFKDKVFF